MNFKKDILLENSISKKSFGRTKRGDKISLFELKNVNGMEVHIINYGCTITSIQVPDRKGELKEVAFGHETIEGYEERNDYFGCIVGRVANRIGNATFTIDDKTYKLAKNDKSNGLHGGYAGFDKQVWDAEPFEEEEATGVVLTYLSKDGEEGYPGELKCKVIYSLNNNNELRIEYYGITSKKTVLNLTNHTYFNLLDGGASSILNHKLQINASYYTPIDDRLITTGEIAPVVNTPFDFRKPKTIGKEIEDENKQLKNGLGYDHNFILDKEDDILDLVATVVEPSSGLTLEVYTTEPGLQLYSGNFLKGDIKGKKGVIYKHRNGFCLETQHFPDSPNKPQFPSIELNPGEDFKSITIYRFEG